MADGVGRQTKNETGGAEGSNGNEAGEGGVVDKHGHPGISQGKYERDIKERDEKIAELEAKVAEAAKTEEGRESLEAEIKALKEEQSDRDTTYELKLAGCVDVKAAKARLDDFDGSVNKLKDQCPYLFNTKPTGQLGFAPSGAPSMTKGDIRKIKDKKERLEAIQANMGLFEN